MTTPTILEPPPPNVQVDLDSLSTASNNHIIILPEVTKINL